MLELLFLAIKPLPAEIWRSCSGLVFVILVLFAATSMKIFRRLDLRQLQSAGVTLFIFYLFGIVGIAVTLLQLYNTAILGAFWPFFTGIVFQLTAVMFQFARIILLPQ